MTKKKLTPESIEEAFKGIKPTNSRVVVAYTGKKGKINYLVELRRNIRAITDQEFTEQEEKEYREQLEKELFDGIYKIS